MAVLISSSSRSSHLILHRFLQPPPPPPSSYLLSLSLFKPITAIRRHTPPQLLTTSFTSLPPSLSLSPHQPPLLSPPHALSTSQPTLEPKIEDQLDDNDDDDDDGEFEIGKGDFESEEEEEEIVGDVEEKALNPSPLKLPSLSVKEKKELASYAHGLGRKLKTQQVGKSGVTDSVATALIETLEANELLKLKIHNSCPGELDDVVKRLQQSTGSMVVGQIGRTVILYRPSLTKLKAEEKKKQAQRVFRRKQQAFKSSFENKGQLSRLSGHGRRGSSRFSSSP
ncbi:unnamed protein product [Camellia sinensis]